MNLEKLKTIRNEFPILEKKVKGNGKIKRLIYLDSAATSQKPTQVINAITNFYKNSNSNVHRGLNSLGEEATKIYEHSRKVISQFINADTEETVFVRNATEGINLVAHSFVKPILRPGDTILLTEMEHHANIVPWQIIAKEKGARLDYISFNSEGKLNIKELEEKLKTRPVFVSITFASNVLGTINPIEKIIRLAKKYKVPILIDAAQAVTTKQINVKKLNCDFLVFSSHKMFGPSGIGVLYGKKEHLKSMQPFLGGGDMIKSVSFHSFKPNEIPFKFEAGTPNIEGAVGLASAIDFINKIGIKNIDQYLNSLTEYALNELLKIKEIKIYGPKKSKERASLISFNLADIHSHDLTSVLDEDGIMIRSGHHCAQPIIDKLGVPSVARISLQIYNTREDIDTLMASLNRAKKLFKI